MFADIATVVLLADMDCEIVEQIRAASDADDINVTIGILSAEHDLSPQDVSAWLHATAEATGRRLADVARDILARYGHPRDDQP